MEEAMAIESDLGVRTVLLPDRTRQILSFISEDGKIHI
jgi:hypothetical protein